MSTLAWSRQLITPRGQGFTSDKPTSHYLSGLNDLGIPTHAAIQFVLIVRIE